VAAEVFFTDMRASSRLNLLDKLIRLFRRAGLEEAIDKEDYVAIKLHVGEPGNLSYIRPPYVGRLVQEIKSLGGRPFLTDANTLYRGDRDNALSHFETALHNGFSYSTVGAPFIAADGLRGLDYVRVPINGKHIREARVAAAVYQSDSLLVLSHFKGHLGTGFGGAIKNLGMGCASRPGKQEQHDNVLPRINKSRCRGCGRCIRWCPMDAIILDGGKARINAAKCQGCAECIAVCTYGAVSFSFAGDLVVLQEKMAEYALAATIDKEGKCGYINFLCDISPDCDCNSWNDVPLAPDIGFLASKDPVALDQASVDLVNKAVGKDLFGSHHRGIDWRVQLEHAEAMGLGSRTYRLIRV
jgi:uncharacterized Fe-S center protein